MLKPTPVHRWKFPKAYRHCGGTWHQKKNKCFLKGLLCLYYLMNRSRVPVWVVIYYAWPGIWPIFATEVWARPSWDYHLVSADIAWSNRVLIQYGGVYGCPDWPKYLDGSGWDARQAARRRILRRLTAHSHKMPAYTGPRDIICTLPWIKMYWYYIVQDYVVFNTVYY